MLKKISALCFLFIFLWCRPYLLQAADFTTTKSFSNKIDRCSISVDFPIQGKLNVIRNIKQWICDVLETDFPNRLETTDFNRIIQKYCDQYQNDFASGFRTVEIFRAYKDKEIVTFQADITDKDSITWITQDCASFSKEDGHKLSIEDIFNCSENKIKSLMWQFRGNLPMEVKDAQELVIGNVGYIDGWVIVIGPAQNHNGAIFKIKYETAEPFLHTTKNGGYYHDPTPK